ncbi:MAG: glycosyltransferase family 4 protein [Pyrinomonadaceae bacterium]|nr:glycosyltransferase family 4 protein [Pyrinomonadaceae bacterium]
MVRVGVMHITDTLDAGGAERVAVDLVNVLPREHYRAHLCTTRRDGLLADLVAENVGRLRLERERRFDVKALGRMTDYIQRNQIQILHAHGPSLFIAAMAAFFPPHPALIWHNHYGRYALEDRPAWLYRLATRRVSGVIAVNRPLVEWSQRQLRVPAERTWYVPNFVSEAERNGEPLSDLPGKAGGRIVCVANLNSEKDHLTLLRAMALVIRQAPVAHLLLVGAANEPAYLDLVRKEISRQDLGQHISLLGQQQDVSAILRACDIGVLSSASEGLPMALLEYGMAGLPTVATRVGQCAEVLDDGRAGILIPPAAPDKLAEALVSLLRSPERRTILGNRFYRRVREVYSPGPVIQQISRVYDTVINSR